MHKIPEGERAELQVLIKNPEINPNLYHNMTDKWFGLSYSDPTIGISDWILLFGLVMAAAPILFMIILRSVLPMSVHIIRLASVARAITRGNFGYKTIITKNLPRELIRLSEDINMMSDQLYRYEKELKVSNVALAHELRSPLTASIGRLQGMLDGVFNCSEEQLKMVMLQLQSLNNLVDDLNFLSLADAGQLHLNRIKCDVRDIIYEKLSWLNPKLLEKEIKVDFNHHQGFICHIDPFRIGQVIIILLDNAIKYASDGQFIKITSEVKNDSLCISLSDRGPGVNDELMDTIFQRFSRADESRSRHSGGSGLGLSIAQAICNAHGGNLNVIRNEYGGLTFILNIPAQG